MNPLLMLLSVAALVSTTITGGGWVVAIRRAIRLARYLRTDRLTGLANRDGLAHTFAGAINRQPASVGVLLLDLDGFKAINDQYGHAVGNTVLQHVAGQLAGACRLQVGEVPVRLHGDEFAVLLSQLPAGHAGLATADRRATAITTALACPIQIGGQVITPAASVGAAVCATGHAELSALLRAADQRMYASKHARGRHTYLASAQVSQIVREVTG